MIPFLHRLPAATMEESPLWLIVLADMMTNLMLFFLVMFALAQQAPGAKEEMVRSFDASQVVEARPRPEDAGMRLAVEEMRAADALKALFADTDVAENLIRVRLQNQILFPVAQASLSGQAHEPIAKLARVLKEMSNTVVIEGHTDTTPLSKSAYHSNWELSVARSNSVIETLVEEGVPAERLVASGYGEFRPAAPNDSRAGRARNRRVEVIILRGKEHRDE
ncbi:MAG: OmpA family protein [Elusimicrobiota bacterium]